MAGRLDRRQTVGGLDGAVLVAGERPDLLLEGRERAGGDRRLDPRRLFWHRLHVVDRLLVVGAAGEQSQRRNG